MTCCGVLFLLTSLSFSSARPTAPNSARRASSPRCAHVAALCVLPRPPTSCSGCPQSDPRRLAFCEASYTMGSVSVMHDVTVTGQAPYKHECGPGGVVKALTDNGAAAARNKQPPVEVGSTLFWADIPAVWCVLLRAGMHNRLCACVPLRADSRGGVSWRGVAVARAGQRAACFASRECWCEG